MNTASNQPGQPQRVKRRGLISEYVYFLTHYKMWWLLPLLALFLLVGFLVVLSASNAGLLMYALF